MDPLTSMPLERPRWAILIFLLLTALAWMLLHPYWGLAHDSVMYMLQGLSHLHPRLYANDIYLRYGSQDRFSIFGPLYAQILRLFGPDHGAELVTALSQLAFAAAGWRLARQLMPSEQALLATALLLVVRLPYGANDIFHVLEDFATPRVAAEALTLWALSAWVAHRPVSAAIGGVLALLMHPLLALSGWLIALWRVAARHIKLTVVLAAAAITLMLAAGLMKFGVALRYDNDWFDIMSRWTAYLQLLQWSPEDWARATLPLPVLACAIIELPDGTLRNLTLAALVVYLLGLLISLVGGDWLHLRIILQGQAWRWQWTADVIAVLCIPPLFARLHHDKIGQAVLLSLVASFLLQFDVMGLAAGLLAVAFSLLRREPEAWTFLPRQSLWPLALIVLVSAVAFGIAHAIAGPHGYFPDTQTQHPWWPVQLRAFNRNFAVLPLVLAAAWWLLFHRPRAVTRWSIALLAAFGCAGYARIASATWLHVQFPARAFAASASWRALVPEGTEVLAAANPLYVWILLQRPSYLSGPQVISSVFSRAAAFHVDERTQELGVLGGGTSDAYQPLSSDASAEFLCSHSHAAFAMTAGRSTLKAAAQLPSDLGSPMSTYRLYRCEREAQRHHTVTRSP